MNPFRLTKKAPWEIDLDPNAAGEDEEDSPQIQMKLEPEVQLDEGDTYHQETPLDDDAEEEFMQNLANSQRITPAGLREMEVKVGYFMSKYPKLFKIHQSIKNILK